MKKSWKFILSLMALVLFIPYLGEIGTYTVKADDDSSLVEIKPSESSSSDESQSSTSQAPEESSAMTAQSENSSNKSTTNQNESDVQPFPTFPTSGSLFDLVGRGVQKFLMMLL